MATVTKKPSTMSDLHDAVKALPRDLDYAKLLPTLHEAGWLWRARQTGLLLGPNSALVTYDLMMGKEEPLQVVDTETVQVPLSVVAITLAGRMQVETSFIYALTGRLPPAPSPVAQAAAGAPTPRPGQVNGGDDEDDTDYQEQDPYSGEYTDAPEPLGRRAIDPDLDVVEGYTDTNLPVFADLYSITGNPHVIVSKVLDELRNTMPKVKTPEMLVEVWKAPYGVEFVKDLGTTEQKAEMAAIFKSREHDLEGASPAPHRRARA